MYPTVLLCAVGCVCQRKKGNKHETIPNSRDVMLVIQPFAALEVLGFIPFGALERSGKVWSYK